ncbi:MAG TPA: type II toxin-antitoxin system RelE/ParE family toxin [Polyangia bacterium]|jgi:mRNA-degrading endonuclease RelE of RelBE toxin-antitoxin system|nr:type II toxin-antitoxin system RelE/ParE family toxin [Polyangia bacterium]
MRKAAGRYFLEWDPTAQEEFEVLKPFDAGPILRAIRELRYQAEDETRNRKPLRQAIRGVPEASWELRIGDHRVLYDGEKHRTVRLLRVSSKGG